MPRFAPDPSKVTTGFPIYPKGEYTLEVGEPKSFYKAATQIGKSDNHGIRFACKIVEPDEFKGKPYMVNCFMHTPESEGFSKSFQMAALGYNPANREDQARFNDEKGGEDWGYNTDDNSAGDGWHSMKGKVVRISLDLGMGQDGSEQQKLLGYKPF